MEEISSCFQRLNQVGIYFSGRKLGLVFYLGDMSSENSARLTKARASEIIVKLSKTVRATARLTALQDVQCRKSSSTLLHCSERQTLCNTIKDI